MLRDEPANLGEGRDNAPGDPHAAEIKAGQALQLTQRMHALHHTVKDQARHLTGRKRWTASGGVGTFKLSPVLFVEQACYGEDARLTGLAQIPLQRDGPMTMARGRL